MNNDGYKLDEAVAVIMGLLRECYSAVDGCLCYAERLHQASVAGGEEGIRAALHEMRANLRTEVIAVQEKYIRDVSRGMAKRLASDNTVN